MSNPNQTTSTQLARLFERSADLQQLWRPDELVAVWRHQLGASLELDLGGLDDRLAAQLRALTTPGGAPARTFGDLLHHPAPPLALLERVKEFGKAHWTHPQSLLPRDLSMALYYSAIAAALVRCERRRISSLDNDTLARGLQNAAGFEWLDENTRALLQAALAMASDAVHVSGPGRIRSVG